MVNTQIVDTDAMQRASSYIEGVYTHACSLLNTTATTCEDLAAAWTGVAATDFNSVMNQWIDDFQRVCNGLAQIRDATNTMGAKYAASEDTNQSDIGQFANHFGGAISGPLSG